jgi:hypothetical protein
MRRLMTLAAFALSLGVAAAASAQPWSGTAGATWSNPVLSGNVIDGATRAPTFYNNTGSAYCDIGCPVSTSGSPLTWGSGTPNSVTFSGIAFSNVAANTPFDFGALSYTNTTNGLASLIFGADLSISFSLTLGSGVSNILIPVGIVTTANTGTPAQNADFLTFGGISSTLDAYEGQTVTAYLVGEIDSQGNPVLQGISPDPTSNGGFVGGPGGLPVPEPAPLALIAAPLLVLAVLRARRA